MDTSERMKKAVVMYYNGKGTTSAPRQGEARTEDNTHTNKTKHTRVHDAASHRGRAGTSKRSPGSVRECVLSWVGPGERPPLLKPLGLPKGRRASGSP